MQLRGQSTALLPTLLGSLHLLLLSVQWLLATGGGIQLQRLCKLILFFLNFLLYKYRSSHAFQMS